METPCCKSKEIRAQIEQSAQVDIEPDGSILSVYNFSDPETNEKTLFCGECGSNLEVVFVGEKATLKLTN